MKLIVLDRDGVINVDRLDYVKTVDEWEPLLGSLEAIAALSRHDWKISIATNQSGIGRGYYGLEDFLAMNEKMNQLLTPLGGKVDSIFFCPHVPEDHCACRKPLPGMLLDIIKRYEIDPSNVPMVGDSLRDLQAAVAGGFVPYLVKTGNGLKTMNDPDLPKETKVFDDLASIAKTLLANEA
ncbi:D-glycero-beta-D-manno-heptose 1,7-bisphosphate 7-phosphatase [Basilea psittacipulmonis]|uniref:D,D-heptose 1,7-bisphosphate phosphatase n=1 Tax=Basilea psittacipulmonis DSM 24701 TaxID=1072685 RepID=A0A077DHH2_9BURK|nr:D-glycero-beta-D-manno-heptose 1,7-bisphosphate 7-phosphatase [Basilea psittacipulmonis]AIL33002.1 D,D-heptose 1,7-bisphosphate phosphatase [Basilea psittacipulmonis DSM 24701]